MSEMHPQAENIERTLHRVQVRRDRAGKLSPQTPATWDGDSVDWRNPLTELIEAEEAADLELESAASGIGEKVLGGLRGRLPDDEFKREIFEFVTRQVGEVAFDQFQSFHADFIQWLFADGPHPLRVVKRLFCYVKYKRPDLLLDMGFRTLGDILGDGGGANSGATLHAQCVALFGEVPGGARKTNGAREKMKASAMGNNNRRGGKFRD